MSRPASSSSSSSVGRCVKVTGPMFSGKTSWVISAVEAKKRVTPGLRLAIVTFKGDRRYLSSGESPAIASHFGLKVAATHTCGSSAAALLPDLRANYDVVVFDEAHFIHDIDTVVADLVDAGVTVYVAAIAVDFALKKFENVGRIVADKEVVLRAKCAYCGRDAAFNLKLAGDMGKRFDVGAAEKYASVCRRCYWEYKVA